MKLSMDAERYCTEWRVGERMRGVPSCQIGHCKIYTIRRESLARRAKRISSDGDVQQYARVKRIK